MVLVVQQCTTVLQTLTSTEVVGRIKAFKLSYVQDWRDWLLVFGRCEFRSQSVSIGLAQEFKHIMGKWQACRPKALRSASELQHTLASSADLVALLGSANLRTFQNAADGLTDSICSLWQIFESGLCVQGKATEVGITKAILLVTRGKLGPAFDSNVKAQLNAGYVTSSETYLKALATVACELAIFETRERRSIENLAADAGRPADVGRVIDMILGPR